MLRRSFCIPIWSKAGYSGEAQPKTSAKALGWKELQLPESTNAPPYGSARKASVDAGFLEIRVRDRKGAVEERGQAGRVLHHRGCRCQADIRQVPCTCHAGRANWRSSHHSETRILRRWLVRVRPSSPDHLHSTAASASLPSPSIDPSPYLPTTPSRIRRLEARPIPRKAPFASIVACPPSSSPLVRSLTLTASPAHSTTASSRTLQLTPRSPLPARTIPPLPQHPYRLHRHPISLYTRRPSLSFSIPAIQTTSARRGALPPTAGVVGMHLTRISATRKLDAAKRRSRCVHALGSWAHPTHLRTFAIPAPSRSMQPRRAEPSVLLDDIGGNRDTEDRCWEVLDADDDEKRGQRGARANQSSPTRRSHVGPIRRVQGLLTTCGRCDGPKHAAGPPAKSGSQVNDDPTTTACPRSESGRWRVWTTEGTGTGEYPFDADYEKSSQGLPETPDPSPLPFTTSPLGSAPCPSASRPSAPRPPGNRTDDANVSSPPPRKANRRRERRDPHRRGVGCWDGGGRLDEWTGGCGGVCVGRRVEGGGGSREGHEGSAESSTGMVEKRRGGQTKVTSFRSSFYAVSRPEDGERGNTGEGAVPDPTKPWEVTATQIAGGYGGGGGGVKGGGVERGRRTLTLDAPSHPTQTSGPVRRVRGLLTTTPVAARGRSEGEKKGKDPTGEDDDDDAARTPRVRGFAGLGKIMGMDRSGGLPRCLQDPPFDSLASLSSPTPPLDDRRLCTIDVHGTPTTPIQHPRQTRYSPKNHTAPSASTSTPSTSSPRPQHPRDTPTIVSAPSITSPTTDAILDSARRGGRDERAREGRGVRRYALGCRETRGERASVQRREGRRSREGVGSESTDEGRGELGLTFVGSVSRYAPHQYPTPAGDGPNEPSIDSSKLDEGLDGYGCHYGWVYSGVANEQARVGEARVERRGSLDPEGMLSLRMWVRCSAIALVTFGGYWRRAEQREARAWPSIATGALHTRDASLKPSPTPTPTHRRWCPGCGLGCDDISYASFVDAVGYWGLSKRSWGRYLGRSSVASTYVLSGHVLGSTKGRRRRSHPGPSPPFRRVHAPPMPSFARTKMRRQPPYAGRRSERVTWAFEIRTWRELAGVCKEGSEWAMMPTMIWHKPNETEKQRMKIKGELTEDFAKGSCAACGTKG
ncbi:hypothetical protein FA13DRAFT_1708115 [Coprinellus micaceus]|uniref:Uncharacterized protein n=1 Tax=Coprinellus micaceus TaxID=71717 RepID=A0A4Y7TIY5_COPMI|nr:hypothetical protein FA13DRAFT_1708115 [Coprinellus micaceus]